MDEENSFEIVAQAGRKGTWRLSLHPDSLELKALQGDESFEISRSESVEKIELRQSRFFNPMLVVSTPKRIVFQLEPPQLAALNKWLGPPTLQGLKVALKRRLRWALPIGIFFIITSIPLPGDPEAGIESIPFDPISAILGFLLAALAIVAKFWPRRILFFFDGLWFSLLSLHVIFNMIQDYSWWWSILVIFLILGAVGGFSEYRRFSAYRRID